MFLFLSIYSWWKNIWANSKILIMVSPGWWGDSLGDYLHKSFIQLVFLSCYQRRSSHEVTETLPSLPEWLRLPQYASWGLLAGSDQEQRQPQPVTGAEISLKTESQPQKQMGLTLETSKQNIEFWESWNWAYEKETHFLRMFSKGHSQW